jgi:O-antigen ligase
MELTVALPRAGLAPRRLSARVDPDAVGAWTLSFTLVFYLALRDGGYDTILRSEVGVALWWIVLLAALAGILPRRIGGAGWVAIALLGGFAVWTGVAIGWSQSPENSVVELAREATYVGFLVLAIALQGRASARHTVSGLACAIGLVTVLAVLSRLHPQAFPANAQLAFLGTGAVRRLSYPINYWNGLAAFTVIGVPLLLAIAVSGRRIAGQALSAGLIPVSLLCIYLTVSRGGVLELGVALVALMLLFPRRLEVLGTLIVAGCGGAILIWAASSRAAMRSGLATPAATHQGTKMLVLTAIVCAGVALLQAAMALAARSFSRPRGLAIGRRATARLALALGAGALLIGIAAGAPSAIEHQWHNFKLPAGLLGPRSNATVFSRLQVINGNGRYQYWQSAANADHTSPWLGIGPGTFEYWWAGHATTPGSVRNAHSLYLETLGETGIVGLALLGGFLVWLSGVTVARSFRASAETRVWLAAAGAGLAAFLAAAAIEWVWQLGAIVAAVLLLGAVIVAGHDAPARRPAEHRVRRLRWLPSAVFAGLALAGIVAIAIPLAAALDIRQSQAAAGEGNLARAYEESVAAQGLQPYAATPRLQEALVLEVAGNLGAAADAAAAATRNDPTNWQTWLTLARIDARRGAIDPALHAMHRAQELNRLSPIFRW